MHNCCAMSNLKIIDAHSHLWYTQDTSWNGMRISPLPNGRSMFLGEERQMLPPFMIDGHNTAEVFLSNMDYAQVSAAVVVQEFIDGLQNDYLKEVVRKYPDRFFVCGMVDYLTPGFYEQAQKLIIEDGFRGIAIPGHRLITDCRQKTIDYRLQTTDERQNTIDYRRQTTDERLQTKDYRLQTTDYRRQTTDERLQTKDYRLQTTDYRRQTTDERLQTKDYRLQTTDCRLQTTDERQLTTDERQLTTDCRLQNSHHSPLVSDEMMRMFKLMEEKDVILSITLADGDEQVAEMREVIQECPRLKVAIGHLGMANPPVTPPWENPSWREQMLLARNEHVMVETGGITWLYNDEFYPFPSAVRAIREAAELVGMDKVMWGSDYPRTITAITYRMSYDFLTKSKELTEDEKRLLLGENAQRFYGFGELKELPYIKNMSE